jgi:signal transduction histidine kinase
MTAAFSLALALLMATVCGVLIINARVSEERNADEILRVAAIGVQQESRDEGALRQPAQFIKEQAAELRGEGLLVFTAPAVGRAGVAGGADEAGARTVRVPVVGRAIVIGLPWRRTEQRLRSQAIALAGLALTAVIVGTAGAWIVVGRTLSPIAALARVADSATVDGLRVHLNAPSSDAEILQLVTTLNGLLERLAGTAANQARFYAAASHELRTPLHALSGHLEVGLSRERSGPEYREVMEEAYRQATRLSSLVQDLLLLTRLNTAASAPVSDAVSLEDVCDRAEQELAGRIQARRLCVRRRFDLDAIACVPPGHAAMMARNLLENAVNYASPGGRLEIVAAAERTGEGSVVLRIFNECPPLEVADVRQLLEPFFRPDASRHSETGGNGLGLAICDAIARSNRWRFDLEHRGDGFQAEVRMPRATVQSQSNRGCDPQARL